MNALRFGPRFVWLLAWRVAFERACLLFRPRIIPTRVVHMLGSVGLWRGGTVLARARLFNTDAYVSLATDDNYAIGALALGQSLRKTGTTRKLALIISDRLTLQMR